jgi:hypothetical protein
VKVCARCRVAKPKADFYGNRRWRDGCHPYCKPCFLGYQRERRKQRVDRENPTRRRWSSSFVCHDYFSRIDDPIKAYVAGLLAADGNVLDRQQRVSLELAHRDRELVYLVRDQLAPRFPVRERLRKNGCHTVKLTITSSELCRGLAGLGIVPRKSLTLEWPRTLARSSARPFLLGYFDGDSYITWSKNGRYRYPRWGLTGTRAFLANALRFIVEETGTRPRRIRRNPPNKAHVVHINGRDAWIVDEWLHADTGLGLTRKRLRPPIAAA